MSRAVQLAIKHALDRLTAFILLCVIGPLMLAIAAAIVIESGRPALFVQTRVGRHGQFFPVYKFRTMIQGAVHKGLGTTIAANDERITYVGAFLRSSSLDELPQFLNVLKGEMSLVGPRPTFEYQVAQYTPFQRRRQRNSDDPNQHPDGFAHDHRDRPHIGPRCELPGEG